GTIAVGFDPVWRQLPVEQERHRQGEHLGLPGAVVAAQQQVTAVEVELLDVVVEEVNQADAQPPPASGPRHWQATHDASTVDRATRGCATVKRWIAGRPMTSGSSPAVTVTSRKVRRVSTACATSACSAPGLVVSLRQNDSYRRASSRVSSARRLTRTPSGAAEMHSANRSVWWLSVP